MLGIVGQCGVGEAVSNVILGANGLPWCTLSTMVLTAWSYVNWIQRKELKPLHDLVVMF